jgi:N-hydroxyarylamine O-acetyltransferase
MGKVNDLFRKRIGLDQGKMIRFEDLHDVLEKTARTIPFENFCIIKGQSTSITEEHLISKILVRNEGGVCYELNPVLYLFLQANGFEVSLVRGAVFEQQSQDWSPTGRTHLAIIIKDGGKSYLVDTGFGSNLPLKPVPLNGDVVRSNNGEFMISKVNSPFGNYLFNMKRRGKDRDWVKGYVFDTVRLTELAELEEMQSIIVESEDSPFNKSPLITRLTSTGGITLTKTSFTEWGDGGAVKRELDEKEFAQLAEKYFGVKY